MYEDKPYSYLMHYGTPRHSGRYPWGSGDNPYQRNMNWYAQYKEYKAQGYSDNECAALFGMNTREFREQRSRSKEQEINEKRIRAMRLKEHGNSNAEIARLMGTNESNVRNWLSQSEKTNNDKINTIADILKKNVDEKDYIDVGKGVELDMNISRERMKTALAVLKEKGYVVEDIQVEQATNPGNYTTVQVLAKPETTKKDIWNNRDNIQSITEYSPNGGLDFQVVEFPPASVDSSRIYIRYDEDGGSERDGVIELRRNVPDLSLEGNTYAQTRIAVDGTHYMKGMAIYSDNIPDGYDVVYNTNKHEGTPKEKVFKEMKADPENPFGATIKAKGQYYYEDENGEKKLGAINVVKFEGDVEEYSRNLSSQFLSKQSDKLIKRQLNLSYSEKMDEYDEISKLTNPTVKQKMLEDFAETCDSASVHLKAAALPRQACKFILPVPEMADNEVYAPGFHDGETVCLIRYPHAGTFEIPELVVNNNRNEVAKKLLGNATDAIGINKHVADILSGADFDGDTVVVIPTNDKVKITTSKPLKGLEGFDPKDRYPGYEGMKEMTSREKGMQMGLVSNLITDMTLKGAPPEDVVRAVRHSMVVIDAEKHKLDWRASAEDNGIAELQEKYQGKKGGGAATLISKASGEMRINKRKRDWKPNEEGEWVYSETGETYSKAKKYTKDVIDKKTGETIHKKGDFKLDAEGNKIYEKKVRQEKTTKMAYVKDARELSSGHPTEEAYADYANKLKSLANKCRKEAMSISPTPVNTSAKEKYKEQVASLDSKLNLAKKNSPRERMAQIKTNAAVKTQRGVLDKEHLKKYASQQLAINRVKFGAGKQKIEITPLEWEAIQNNAISTSKLKSILANSDMETVKKLATPRAANELSVAKQNRIKSLEASGYTTAEIAKQLGISSSTVNKYAK